jgi:hypothetical protein
MVSAMKDHERRMLERLGCEPEDMERIEIDINIDLDALATGPENRLILLSLGALHRKVNKIMGDLTALNTAVDNLVAAESAAATELGELRDEVAQLTAGEITQEQIDAITTKVTGVADALTAASADPAPPAEPPAETPPAETPPVEEPPAETPPQGEPPEAPTA